MVQATENWRFIGFILALVAVLTWGVALTVVGVLSPSSLRLAMRYLTIATGAAGIAIWLLNRYVWRLWGFRQVLKIPDLSGRWEGWYYRTLTKEWVPCAHEVSQRALDIVVNAWGPKNWSRSICASIVRDAHGASHELVWSYKTELTGPPHLPGDTHNGTHFFRISERQGVRYLEGTYITDRVREGDKTMGAGGFQRVVWVSKALRSALDYDSNRWGMAKPEEPSLP